MSAARHRRLARAGPDLFVSLGARLRSSRIRCATVVVLRTRLPAGLAFLASGLTLLLGCLSLSTNALERLPLPMIGCLVFWLTVLLLDRRWTTGAIEPSLLCLIGLCLIVATMIGGLPEYLGGGDLSGIVHRSIVSAIALTALGLVGGGTTLYFLLGATPRAEDLSRYPLIVLPSAAALAVYGFLLFRLVGQGLPQVDLEMIARPYLNIAYPTQEIDASGQTIQTLRLVVQGGFSNYLLGTGWLILLTSLIALPVGVGTGVYVSEYATGAFGRAVRFSTTALRGISVFILGLAAVSLVTYARATPLALPFAGYLVDTSGAVRPEHGSSLPGAIVISMLVIPVIARATEEGCRSVPDGLREGSFGLGASEGYTLRRIILPWALPNIVTGLVLGWAETAGSLAPLLFIAGPAETGFGPLGQATSLSWAVFGATYSGSKPFRDQLGPHQHAAALLLLVLAVLLNLAAMALKRRFAARGRGA